jgi:hypothetical protein
MYDETQMGGAQTEAQAANGMMAPTTPDEAQARPTFLEQSTRLSDNLASATLRLVDAAQDFTGLISSFVEAGKELERSIATVRELAETSRLAMEESQRAAFGAAASARESEVAKQQSMELIQRSTAEHLAIADLTENLRQRIVALAVLGAPLPKPVEEAPEAESEPEENAASTEISEPVAEMDEAVTDESTEDAETAAA